MKSIDGLADIELQFRVGSEKLQEQSVAPVFGSRQLLSISNAGAPGAPVRKFWFDRGLSLLDCWDEPQKGYWSES